MRLSPTGNLSNQGRNERAIRSKPKHKKLDLICEKKYNQNRLKIESPKLSEVNDDTSEVRRSSRVRRAPSVLDASPAPPKKRKITERNGDGSSRSGRDRYHRSMKEEDSGEWNSRLRTRPRKVTFMNGDCDSSPKSKKNLFGHSDGVKEEDSDLMDSRLDDKKGGLVGETSMVVQPKRPGRIKATNIVNNEEISLGNIDKDEEETNVLHVVKDNSNGFLSDNEAPIESLQQGNDISLPVTSDSKDNANNIVQSPEQIKPVEQEQPESDNQQNQTLHEQVTSTPENHVQEENTNVVDEHRKHSPNHRDHKPRIKKGRCCGMCGGGTDGKPPKILVNDGAGSDNEAYSGSSSSEEPTYDIWDGFGDEPGWLGRLLGPINDRFGIAGIWVHQQCAVWSPEVYFAGLGCLKNVRSALFRGRVLKCSRCGRRGATIGCRVDRCPKTYHLPCARVNGCIFDHRKFLIACTDHRHLFQPHGAKLLKTLKKLKTKKLKSQLRKTSNEASRKDLESEEKFLENIGEDDEFLKRERKRLHRDISRIAPVFIGGPNPSPESPIPFQGFDSVGGLHPVIQSLKEVVILPLLYPEFFENVGLTPPRGVLLHGYPGTGKTLLVRSLIGSCARGDKRIAYFARKGADCLGKYVGDAERQLRLLFQVAEKSQPSIIFFDEIDGLAPSRTRVQDQTHNSVVSTLLALLDGLKSRGSVIVIGATNRPDAIDPALRRPGRFDREIYFPLPNLKDREEILSLHTKKWPSVIDKKTLNSIAKKTVGYAGADLQALCTQTAIIALKRNCPWDKLLLCAEEKGQFGKRPVLPDFAVSERDWLDALSRAPPPCSRREAGMAANEIATAVLPVHLLPCLIQSVTKLVLLLYLDGRVSLPGPLLKTAELIKKVIVSVLDKRGEKSECWWGRVEDADVAGEVERALVDADVLVGNDGGIDEVSNGFMHNNNNNNNNKKLGFCVLICGNSGSGQRHLASCVLQCFVGNAALQKVDLATMLHEGSGNIVQGLSQILVRCAGVGSCMVFMPRIDLWAIETYHQVGEEEESEQTKKTEIPPDLKASGLWSSFVEQAESIFISSSLMILATSEVPFEMLPLRVKDFFGKTDKQNLNPSSHIGTTIPRFSVNVDQKFDRELVIASSTKKLSNDVARLFIELTHQKTHIHDEKSNADVDNNTVMEEEDYTFQNQTPVTPPPTKKEEKGKSNLMLAISTFGYQILQYPHFAELCWVTSKLKQGPSTEINGPWKGWPFNSCIIRPSETNNNVKSKEKYGFVRGLIAVGLMAYRGVYSSLREVSGDVRKVLEVLSEEINARVEGGKDRRQFARVLSQVACLEDMVDSWAYSLQSLETPQVLESKNDVVQGEDPTNQEESTKENTQGFDDIIIISKEENDNSVDEPISVLQTQESTSFKDPQNAPLIKDLNHPEHSNGFVQSESVTIIPDGPCTSVDHTVPNKNPIDNNPKDQVCLYKFCPKCMSNLGKIIQKNLTSEWDKSCDVTTEEVHETVTWVSLNLHKNIRTFFEKRETRTCCQCEVATCHGDDVSGASENELELIYKKGVVGVLEGSESESESDVCFHCKFERLCLCDVIEYIVRTSSSREMTKSQPSGCI